jgi:hypothetical protein
VSLKTKKKLEMLTNVVVENRQMTMIPDNGANLLALFSALNEIDKL